MTPVVWLWLLSVVTVATVVGIFCYGLGQRNEARRMADHFGSHTQEAPK